MFTERGEIVGNELLRIHVVPWRECIGSSISSCELRGASCLRRVEVELEPLVSRLLLGYLEAPLIAVPIVAKLSNPDN